jgi:glutaredoxin-related protein
MKQDFIEMIQQKLIAFSEKELQSRIIEPLLRADGFEQVRDVSGPNEKGKDLIAIKTEMSGSILYAIQIKKIEVTGKVQTTTSLLNLFHQLKQAIIEPTFDPFTNSSRVPDVLLFITPYRINRHAFDAARASYNDIRSHQIRIIDGPILVDSLIRLLPNVVASLDVEIAYRFQNDSFYDKIPESTAFGCVEPLELHKIYVEAEYELFTYLRLSLKHLLNGYSPKIDRGELNKIEKDAKQSLELSIDHLSSNSALIKLPTDNDKKSEKNKDKELVQLIILAILQYVRLLQGYILTLNSGGAVNLSIEDMFHDALLLQKEMLFLTKNNLLLGKWRYLNNKQIDEIIDLLNDINSENNSVSAHYLHHARTPIFIKGEPGAGKTTLLRMLRKRTAMEQLEYIPVLIRVIDVSEISVNGILNVAEKEIQSRGWKLDKATFNEKLTNGSIRLLIDGLDEAGRNVQLMKKTILSLNAKNPLCSIIVTSRDVVEFDDWESAIHIRLNPLRDNQLIKFITNWFSAEPSAAEKILQWLSNEKKIKESARTPVIAALLCSLYQADVDLPSTEVELYEKRLDLLLGQWEQAKGIRPMSEVYRKKYKLFITNIALNVHLDEKRLFSQGSIVQLASRFMNEGYNPGTDAFIKDCIDRGLFFVEEDGLLSFGHLTYQEYLVAKQILQVSAIDLVINYLGKAWWKKPLEFYASLCGDISPLLNRLTKEQINKHMVELKRLCSLAPLTPINEFHFLRDKSPSFTTARSNLDNPNFNERKFW